jgi:hypothetical protein
MNTESQSNFAAPEASAVQALTTPGPWQLKWDEERPWSLYIESAGGSVLLAQDRMCFSSRQESLDALMDGHFMGTVSEMREAARVNALQVANLRLMAAAPDMLAALREVEIFMLARGVGANRLLPQVRAAIEAATGAKS